MREMTRRELCLGLSALAATGCAIEAQTAATLAGGVPAGANVMSQSKVFVFEQLPVRKMANGGESRDVLRGTLTTGEVIGVHESQQPYGKERRRRPGALLRSTDRRRHEAVGPER